MMTKSNFALWLTPSLLAEARKLAEAEGVALDQLVNAALAEKLSTLGRADQFGEWAAPAKPPMIGDELISRGKGLKLHWRKT